MMSDCMTVFNIITMRKGLLQVQFKLSLSGTLFKFYHGCSSGGAQGVVSATSRCTAETL
jgi:hypothetical protein